MLILTTLLGCWMQLVMDSIDEKLLRSCSTGDLSSIATLLANHAPSSETAQEMMCKAVYSALSDQPPADWLKVVNYLLQRFPDIRLSGNHSLVRLLALNSSD